MELIRISRAPGCLWASEAFFTQRGSQSQGCRKPLDLQLQEYRQSSETLMLVTQCAEDGHFQLHCLLLRHIAVAASTCTQTILMSLDFPMLSNRKLRQGPQMPTDENHSDILRELATPPNPSIHAWGLGTEVRTLLPRYLRKAMNGIPSRTSNLNP